MNVIFHFIAEYLNFNMPGFGDVFLYYDSVIAEGL